MPDGAARPWPALLREETAAAYLDVSATFFRERIAPQLPRVILSPRVIGYRRADLDRWLDSRAAPGAASPAPENPWHA